MRCSKATAPGLQKAHSPGVSVITSGPVPFVLTSELWLGLARIPLYSWAPPASMAPVLTVCFAFPFQAWLPDSTKEEPFCQWSLRHLCEGQWLRRCYFLTFIRCQWHAEPVEKAEVDIVGGTSRAR